MVTSGQFVVDGVCSFFIHGLGCNQFFFPAVTSVFRCSDEPFLLQWPVAFVAVVASWLPCSRSKLFSSYLSTPNTQNLRVQPETSAFIPPHHLLVPCIHFEVPHAYLASYTLKCALCMPSYIHTAACSNPFREISTISPVVHHTTPSS